MKRYYLLFIFSVFLLLSSCFHIEPVSNVLPDWLVSYIYEIENDTTHADEYNVASIRQYEYKGDIVYYMTSSSYDGYNSLFDDNGHLLGCPDGGFSGQGDGSYTDFSQERSKGVMIWHQGATESYLTPQWVLDLVQRAEAGNDSSFTYAIIQYDYKGQTVYNLSTSIYNDYVRIYDSAKTYLGAPFGGPDNNGDGLLSDFHSERTRLAFIWQKTTFPELTVNEEYQVLNALANYFSEDGDTVLVMDETYHGSLFPDDIEEILTQRGISYEADMITNYINNNSNDFVLNPAKFSHPVVVVSYDRDAVTFHRPGFNQDHTMAVVEFYTMSAPLVGAGGFALLEKNGGIWTVTFTQGIWIA